MPPYGSKPKKRSFFAEQRELNTNPNFINTMDIFYIRQNAKRIIKDIADNLILPEDYVYFTSQNLINALIQEAYEQYLTNKCLRNALQAYRNIVLPQRLVTPDVDIITENTTAGIELAKACNRENVWLTCYTIFNNIANGADPVQSLLNIMRLQKSSIKEL